MKKHWKKIKKTLDFFLEVCRIRNTKQMKTKPQNELRMRSEKSKKIERQKEHEKLIESIKQTIQESRALKV